MLNPHPKMFAPEPLALIAQPTKSSSGRPWDGAAVNWHDWGAGGDVSSPALDHDVIAMRTSGTVRLTQIRDGQTHTATVGVGNVTVHPRGMESKWMWDRPGAIMVMHMPPDLLRQAAEALSCAPPQSVELQNCFERRDLFVERIVMQFLSELQAPVHPSQQYISQAMSHALAAHLVHRFNAHGSVPQKLPGSLSARAMGRVTDYIEAHLHEAIDLETLATLANVSRFHFARLFKRTTGMSAMAYLERQRMVRARALISAGALPLARIAALVGYEDQSYFTRRFRMAVGMTPAAYARATGGAGSERMLK